MLNTHLANLVEKHIIRHATKKSSQLKRNQSVKSVIIQKQSKQNTGEMPNIETPAQNSNTFSQPRLPNETNILDLALIASGHRTRSEP
jgi:hypothetical protein